MLLSNLRSGVGGSGVGGFGPRTAVEFGAWVLAFGIWGLGLGASTAVGFSGWGLWQALHGDFMLPVPWGHAKADIL